MGPCAGFTKEPETKVSETIQERIDRVIDHVGELGARAARIVLTDWHLKELREGPGTSEVDGRETYRGIPVHFGQIGGSSFVESEGAPSGDTNFGV